jgi:hypothetical protein
VPRRRRSEPRFRGTNGALIRNQRIFFFGPVTSHREVVVGDEIMGSSAGLNLPKMETCPLIKEDAYHADKRSSILRFKKSNKQMMARLDLTINT